MRGQIRKRGKSWAVIVYLGRDPQTGKKRRKWYTHTTKRDAEAHLSQLLVQIQGGSGISSTKISVGDYLDQWLADYAVGAVAPTTLKRYQDTVRLHIKPAIGHVPLSHLTAQAIQSYLSARLQQGLSTATTRYHAVILHEALKHAVRWGLLTRNPSELVVLQGFTERR